METKIVLKRVGYSNVVLIVNGNNSVLIDTGVKGNLNVFQELFSRYNLSPENIKLIVLTHVHFDHTGNLNELKKLTGAKVLVHKNEFENLKNGFIRIPDGQLFFTKITAGLGKLFFPRITSPKPLVADFINNDEFDLTEFGINGKVISTPGHTRGSQSVLIGDKLIAGDTFINLRKGMIFPHFAENPKQVLKTWEKLLQMGIREIYPGHGNKFIVEKAVAAYKEWKVKLFSETI